jgi:hypothetical protein
MVGEIVNVVKVAAGTLCPVQAQANGAPGLNSEFPKYRLPPDPNHFYIRRHPVPLRGALRNVTSAGRDAVDADGAPDEGA